MLNIDLVYTLYEGLTPEKKEQLLGLLFKKSRQTMAYFKRSKDISLSKLEILADFYCLPLDFFRTNSAFKIASISGNNNYYAVGNMMSSSELAAENERLKMEKQSLQKDYDTLKDSANSKEDTINALKDHVESLKIQLEYYRQKK